jgi:hypothetical protein
MGTGDSRPDFGPQDRRGGAVGVVGATPTTTEDAGRGVAGKGISSKTMT